MLKNARLPAVQQEIVALAGGLDLVTPAYSLQPGALRDCINFAVNPQGGYYRIPGYQRFSGQPRPSDAQTNLFTVLWSGTIPSVGDVITIGGISATVVVTGATLLGVTRYSGTMIEGDLIKSGATTVGTIVSWYGGASRKDRATYRAAAADIYRADIGPVPGSGPVRGIVFYKDVAYAFRDNSAGTAADVYKSSASGWVKIAAHYRIPFDSGTDIVVDGDTLTKGADTLTVTRIQVTSGALIGGTAKGYIYVSSNSTSLSTGTWHSSSGGHVNFTAATYDSVTLSPGGRYEFDLANFTAAADGLRIYGCNGVGDLFEFDGTVLVKLESGVTANHIKVHKNHLFISSEASLLHSGIGDPYRWEVVDGAGEIGVGDRVTAMLVQPGSQQTGAMSVYGRSSTYVLYGTNSDDWNFVTFNSGTGCIDYTAQNLAESYGLDDRGVVSMSASLKYGNFDTATLTHSIRPFINTRRSLATASAVNRERGQYRVFFSDGFALYATVANGELQGHGIIEYLDPVTCYFDGEYTNGDAIALFGTSNGYVMENDVGTSFDGQAITAQFITNINTAKTPRVRKRWRRLALELFGQDYVAFSVGYAFDWANGDAGVIENVTASMQGLSVWDASLIWDEFYWDGRSNLPSYVELSGSGENVQIIVSMSDATISEFSLNSAILAYSIRRNER